MQNIILVIHLLLALMLIGAVLLQRSEGGALGIGGGGNFMSGRGAATALQKATWGLAAAFIVTSLTLTFFAIQQAEDRGIVINAGGAAVEAPKAPEGAEAPAKDAGAPGELPDLTPGAAAEGGAGAVDDLPPPLDLPSDR